MSLLSVEPFSWPGIGVAILCGTIIGLERQLRGKPVGIRTSALITLGTYAFIISANVVVTDDSDPARIIGQVVTGIGFLGAGVMLAKDGAVVGVTSAATIWALAAIGVSVGIGNYSGAIKLALMVILVLVGVDMLENYSRAFTGGVHSRYNGWKNKRKGIHRFDESL